MVRREAPASECDRPRLLLPPERRGRFAKLPPDGPLEIFVALPPPANGEYSTVVDGSDVHAAAERAKVIWD